MDVRFSALRKETITNLTGMCTQNYTRSIEVELGELDVNYSLGLVS